MSTRFAQCSVKDHTGQEGSGLTVGNRDMVRAQSHTRAQAAGFTQPQRVGQAVCVVPVAQTIRSCQHPSSGMLDCGCRDTLTQIVRIPVEGSMTWNPSSCSQTPRVPLRRLTVCPPSPHRHMPTNQSLPVPQQTHEALLSHQTSSCGNVYFPKLGGVASSLPLPLVEDEDEEPHRSPPAIPNVFLCRRLPWPATAWPPVAFRSVWCRAATTSRCSSGSPQRRKHRSSV